MLLQVVFPYSIYNVLTSKHSNKNADLIYCARRVSRITSQGQKIGKPVTYIVTTETFFSGNIRQLVTPLEPTYLTNVMLYLVITDACSNLFASNGIQDVRVFQK